MLPGRKMNVEKFMDLLRAGASVGDAARGVGVSRTTVYARRKGDEDFAAAWDEAVEEGTDRAETVLAQCALNAKKDPKYQTSLIFLLKNRRPQKWRDAYDHRYSGRVELVPGVPDEQLQRETEDLVKRLEAREEPGP
jgi:AcrR family transcriptional regulator